MSLRRLIRLEAMLFALTLLMSVIFLAALTTCTEETPPDYAFQKQVLSFRREFFCTTPEQEFARDFASYILKAPKSEERNSIDCALYKNFSKIGAEKIRVVVKRVTPSAFDGAKECGEASPFPPQPNASREPPSKVLQGISPESQVVNSLVALAIPRCVNSIFPPPPSSHSVAIEGLALSWLKYRNESPGYDLSSYETPTEVAPVAIFHMKDEGIVIACGLFSNDQWKDLPLSNAAQIYTACLYNFNQLKMPGEK